MIVQMDGWMVLPMCDCLILLIITQKHYLVFLNKDAISQVKSSYENPTTDTQTLSFLVNEDSESNTSYLALVKSVRLKDRSYPALTLCQKEVVFLVAHSQIEDFKNSVFQGRIFKQVRAEANVLCPTTKRIILLGVPTVKSDGSDWTFNADIDLISGQTNLRYRPLSIFQENVSVPTELRKEKTEVLVSVQPTSEGVITQYNPDDIKSLSHVPVASTNTQIPWNYSHKNYSIADLTLLARIARQPIQGQSIIHISTVALDGTAFVDAPVPILISGTQDIKPGWANLQGIFTIQEDKLVIKPIIITPCQKEWCNEK